MSGMFQREVLRRWCPNETGLPGSQRANGFGEPGSSGESRRRESGAWRNPVSAGSSEKNFSLSPYICFGDTEPLVSSNTQGRQRGTGICHYTNPRHSHTYTRPQEGLFLSQEPQQEMLVPASANITSGLLSQCLSIVFLNSIGPNKKGH